MTEPENVGSTPHQENPPDRPDALNPFSALVGVVLSPGETFERILPPRGSRSIWVVPLVLFVVLSIASTLVFVPKLDFESATREALARQGQEPDDAQVEMIVAIQKPFVYTVGVVGTPVAILIIALVYLGGFKAFAGEGKFGSYFAVTVFSWLPQVVKSLIGSAVMATRESIRVEEAQTLVMSNLGFLSDPVESPALFGLLASFDVFSIWTLVLLVIGYRIVSKRSSGESIGIVAGVWAIYVIGKTGLALIGQMASSGAGS
jgi:hypothetical protein